METTTHPSPLTTTAADTLLLTLDEAARQLRCARRSVERQIASHHLAVVHVGRSVRVERRELERFIARMRDQRAEDREREKAAQEREDAERSAREDAAPAGAADAEGGSLAAPPQRTPGE